MTPEQRLAVFAAQTSEDFIANRDAVGLLVRPHGANNNSIYNNTISNSKVGIWVAARTWRNLALWNCSCAGKWVDLKDVPKQPYPQWLSLLNLLKFKSPFNRKIYIVPDEATNNDIYDNIFRNVKLEIIEN